MNNLKNQSTQFRTRCRLTTVRVISLFEGVLFFGEYFVSRVVASPWLYHANTRHCLFEKSLCRISLSSAHPERRILCRHARGIFLRPVLHKVSSSIKSIMPFQCWVSKVRRPLDGLHRLAERHQSQIRIAVIDIKRAFQRHQIDSVTASLSIDWFLM